MRKRYTLRLLSKCLIRSTPYCPYKVPSLISSSVPLDGLLLAYLYTYILVKLLQNRVKFIQKLTPGFKNHMRNFDNFRQAVESLKSWNSMGATFVQKIHSFSYTEDYIQRIYLTLLSTTEKTHQISYVIFEIINHFSRHNVSLFL